MMIPTITVRAIRSSASAEEGHITSATVALIACSLGGYASMAVKIMEYRGARPTHALPTVPSFWLKCTYMYMYMYMYMYITIIGYVTMNKNDKKTTCTCAVSCQLPVSHSTTTETHTCTCTCR